MLGPTLLSRSMPPPVPSRVCGKAAHLGRSHSTRKLRRMKMIPFSRRHREFIENERLIISLDKPLVFKIVSCMEKNDISHSHWESIFRDDLQRELINNLGFPTLKTYVDGNWQDVDDVKLFLRNTQHKYVLDAIEIFCELLNDSENKLTFIKECNDVFKSESSPWRIINGFVVKLDSDFLESEILSKAFELLKDNHFELALRAFMSARENFTAGDYYGVIFESNNALESLIKKVCDIEKGSQKDLKRRLMKSGLVPDYFQGFCDYFDGFVQSAFTIANESARHGKKEPPEDKNKIDYAVASFHLHLVGALIVFIMERYTERSPKETPPPPPEEDDVPF